VFDFRITPFQETNAASEALLTWGDSELEDICSTYFPELDVTLFQEEALAMRLYVRENYKFFLHPKNDKDPSKGKFLALTGPGSIFETSFSRSDVCSKPIPNILRIADYMISFMWQCGNLGTLSALTH